MVGRNLSLCSVIGTDVIQKGVDKAIEILENISDDFGMLNIAMILEKRNGDIKKTNIKQNKYMRNWSKEVTVEP